tara:strand:- start:524 stop:934 length:411 start_codon:yes stop_codon:yes gene_type:complete
MSKKFLDKNIYNRAKKLADEKYKKHSAYKSMYMVEQYEKLGGRIDNKLKKNSGTATWNKEKWMNLTPIAMGLETDIKKLTACGKKYPKQKDNPSICRPTKKINKNTPSLAQSFTKSQIKKALKLKKQNKRINWDEL